MDDDSLLVITTSKLTTLNQSTSTTYQTLHEIEYHFSPLPTGDVRRFKV